MIKKWIAHCLFLFTIIGMTAHAAPFARSDVPDQLKSWVPWALDGDATAGCPHMFNNANPRLCAWPGAIALKANASGAGFAADWQAYRETWVRLPGDERNWPQDVTVDGKPAAVTSRAGMPSIQLATGAHHVTGRFIWNAVPESLALPGDAGLLQLELNGQPVAMPVRDNSNRLWLQRKVAVEGADAAQVRVYRKITDGVPIVVETRIRLEVSGKGRELSIDRALLPDLIPLELTSPLPTILAQDGSLKLQARAGTWDIRFIARHPGPAKAFTLPALTDKSQGLSATEEVWVFEAAPLIRSASIEGPPPVDPQQTTLPGEWRALPGYLMRPNAKFSFKEIRRGDSDPAPDKLSLDRRLWLSFDGSMLTISDRLQGEVNRATRLAMGNPAQLGRADVAGQDQLITRGSDALAGIEVKRGTLAMTADSLVPGAPHKFSAVGWRHDFDRVSMELALPAGWRLLHAGGTDRADGAWLARWNLLDFFLVLVIALAAGQLWGRVWGAVALATLVLTYQEPGAPHFSWIVLLAAVALVRVLPAGRFKSLMLWGQRASLLVLILITLAFATDQVRGALYPVLEQSASLQYGETPVAYAPASQEMDAGAAEAPAPATAAAGKLDMEERERAEKNAMSDRPTSKPQSSKFLSRASKNAIVSSSNQPQRNYQSIDPDAKVQTGPGLPDWRWNSYRLSWDGPVRQDQQLDLWLLSPWANKLLVVLRLILLALLLACIAGVPLRFGRGRFGGSGSDSGGSGSGASKLAKPLATIAITLAALMALGHTEPARAEMPDQDLIDKLKEKLTRPADCLPECAEISRLSLQASGTTLRLGLEVDAAIDTALPLPGGARQWLPREARLDGKPAYIHRDSRGALWLLVSAGRHRVELNGDLPGGDTLQLPLPRKPRRVDVSADGWDVAGISEDTGAADTLQLSRRIKAGGANEAPVLPPFLQVERRLILDLVWRVETTVRRDSPMGVPALAQIPLLPGEAVTTAGVNVKDGKVLVNLGPQADSLSWQSTLSQSAALTLLAPKDNGWVETWIIAASTLWHIDANGIPPVALGQYQNADLAFRPWPGESLTLKIDRPQAIPGQTMTIDNSRLLVNPGTRATDYQLSLVVRSSRGVDHSISLPEGAVLQRVAINGQVRPIRASARQLVLPLVPGKQSIDIVWRVDQGMSLSYSTQPVGLNLASVNNRLDLQLPRERWLLLTSGPGVGPAILFWGKLLILLAVAFTLGRFGGLPMQTRHWMLLALGLTQTPWWSAALVIGWFFAFSMRSKAATDAPGTPRSTGARWLFNLRQVVLVVLTIVMLSVLFEAVQGGLLGQPEMQVVGNHSSANLLRWYVDRATADLQGAWALTLPMLAYRALMLLWALWLAWSLLSWLKWGWNGFGNGGLWQRKQRVTTPTQPTNAAAPNEAEKST